MASKGCKVPFRPFAEPQTVRVIPEATGYLIDVNVLKEQEDIENRNLPRRYLVQGSIGIDNNVDSRSESLNNPTPSTLGWYEIGRDRELEQRIMESILGRVTNVEPPKHKRK